MNQSKTKSVIAGIIAVVILGLLLNTYSVYNRNEELKESINYERLQSEKLLSEKLLLHKEIDEFRGEIASLKGKNKEADVLLERANRNLNEKEAMINSLAKEARDAKDVRRQLAEIKKARQELLEEFGNIADYNNQLKKKNDELREALNNLTAENKSLLDQLKAKSFAGSNFKIEVLKGKKDKLTVKAKRTEKVRIEFEVAANSYPINPKLIHIDLLSPDGALKSGETEVTVENKTELSASLNQALSDQEPQKVMIDYTLKENLKIGVYTAIIFHNNTFLGKAQFRLMK